MYVQNLQWITKQLIIHSDFYLQKIIILFPIGASCVYLLRFTPWPGMK